MAVSSFEFKGFEMQSAGVYSFQILDNDNVIAERHLPVSSR
jgi:hypothetical protein